jgi:hypothetical protein
MQEYLTTTTLGDLQRKAKEIDATSADATIAAANRNCDQQ